MSPGLLLEYLMLTPMMAFCRVKTVKLTYFIIFL